MLFQKNAGNRWAMETSDLRDAGNAWSLDVDVRKNRIAMLKAATGISGFAVSVELAGTAKLGDSAYMLKLLKV